MLKERTLATARIDDRTRRNRMPAARLDAEARRPGERLRADTLDTLMWMADAAVAFAFSVDAGGLRAITMLRSTPGHDTRELEVLLARLAHLEPIDPFSPRRAAACGSTVMSAADAGGAEACARTMYGHHLRRHGYGVPVVMFLRRASAIVAGVTLLRAWDAPPFEPATVRRLRHFHPLLEHALVASAGPCVPEPQPLMLASPLTTREAQIATLVADGASNAAIATVLGLRQATVKTHLTRIYTKLGVRSRTQLALLVREPG